MPLTLPDPMDTQNEHPWRDLILLPRLKFSTGREWRGAGWGGGRREGRDKGHPSDSPDGPAQATAERNSLQTLKRLHRRQGSTHPRNSDTPQSCQPSLGRSCPPPWGVPEWTEIQQGEELSRARCRSPETLE